MIRRALLALSTLSFIPVAVTEQSLPSGSANYVINYQGQGAGNANYTIKAARGGYTIVARGRAKIGTIDLAFSKDEALDGKMEIISESLNGTMNGQAVFVSVKSDGDKLVVGTAANGDQLSNTLDRHSHTVFTPNFDPSAILLFLRHAGISSDLWALIPQQSGLLVKATMTSQKDEKGTLNGSRIVVRHSTLMVANVTSEVFSTADGQLLQQEVPTQGFSLVREGFILTPAKSAAPQPAPSPATTPPPANQ